MQGYIPNWGGFTNTSDIHGSPVVTNPNSALYGARGIDWGKVRLNFSYDQPQASYEQDDNVVFLEQPQQDNTMLYLLGGVAGVLGLILIFRR